MAHELPGTPPIVLRAREIVSASNRAAATIVAACMGTVFAVGAIGIPLFGDPAIVFALMSWMPVMFLLMGRRGPDASTVEDAKAILAAWTERRQAWIDEVIDASAEGSGEDVSAWSSADVELRRMAASQRQRRAEASKQTG